MVYRLFLERGKCVLHRYDDMAWSEEKGAKDKGNGPHHYSAEEENYRWNDGKRKRLEEALLSEA